MSGPYLPTSLPDTDFYDLPNLQSLSRVPNFKTAKLKNHADFKTTGLTHLGRPFVAPEYKKGENVR
jgi:hypothetical protein